MNKFTKGLFTFFVCICLTAPAMNIATASANYSSLDAYRKTNSNLGGFYLPATVINVPTPMAPSGVISDTTPQYKWTKITGATQYQYTLLKGTSVVYTKTVPASVCGASTCVNTPANVLSAAAYKWKVRAMVNGAWKSFSPLKAFSVVIVVPSPISPSGTIIDATPTFTWSMIASATNYQFQLYKGTTLKYSFSVPASACNTTTCSNTPTTVLPYGGYTWKVRAMLGGAWKAYSASKAFTLINVIPVPIAPTGTINTDTPNFTWSKVSIATNYELTVSKGSTVVYSIKVAPGNCTATTCSKLQSTILANALYTWKVRAYVNGVWQAYSPSKSFTVKAASVVPATKAPLDVIVDTTPTYQWSKIIYATAYRYQLFKNGSLVYTKLAPTSSCIANNCSSTPTNILPYGEYTWKVSAQVGGIWRAYSLPRPFSLVQLGSLFDSQFTTNTLGWSPVWGTWIRKAGGYYTTVGVLNTFSSVKHAGNYGTLTYEAKLRRFTSNAQNSNSNYLIIRGNTTTINGTQKEWYNALKFQYTNNGYFSIFKISNGVGSTIQDWTLSPAIKTGKLDWNVLKVLANGNNMKFFINDVEVWRGAVVMPAYGEVGIGMFMSIQDPIGTVFQVDYAKLNMTSNAGTDDLSEYFPVQEVPAKDNGGTSP